jgi:LysM repeat protein
MAHNISTDALLSTNRLKAYCRDFPGAGTKLCIPQQCDIYTVRKNDTCQSIVASQSTYVTITQLQAWNPNLNALCTNMAQQQDMQICVRYELIRPHQWPS